MRGRRVIPLLIGMDSNSHSVLFGNESNKRGEVLEEFILEHGLLVENRGTEPMFATQRLGRHIATCIDVTLSRGLGDKVRDWRVVPDFNGSDHHSIRFQVELGVSGSEELVRNWKKSGLGIIRKNTYREKEVTVGSQGNK